MGFQFVVIYIDSFMDDVTHGMWKPVYRLRFVTCQGVFAMALRI